MACSPRRDCRRSLLCARSLLFLDMCFCNACLPERLTEILYPSSRTMLLSHLSYLHRLRQTLYNLLENAYSIIFINTHIVLFSRSEHNTLYNLLENAYSIIFYQYKIYILISFSFHGQSIILYAIYWKTHTVLSFINIKFIYSYRCSVSHCITRPSSAHLRILLVSLELYLQHSSIRIRNAIIHVS